MYDDPGGYLPAPSLKGETKVRISARQVIREGYMDINEVYKTMKTFLSEKLSYKVQELDFESDYNENMRMLRGKYHCQSVRDKYFKLEMDYMIESKINTKKKRTFLIDGEKRVLHYGKSVFRFNCFAVFDWKNKRKDHWLSYFLLRFFYHYFYEKKFLTRSTFEGLLDRNKIVAAYDALFHSPDEAID